MFLALTGHAAEAEAGEDQADGGRPGAAGAGRRGAAHEHRRHPHRPPAPAALAPSPTRAADDQAQPLTLHPRPDLLVFSTIQPVMFVLLFTYVFGGAIAVPRRVDYIDFLMAGIFVQTVIFGSTQTGVALAEDMQRGMIDRFRSLPMARSAVLAGRTIADTVRNLFVVLMLVVGTWSGSASTPGSCRGARSPRPGLRAGLLLDLGLHRPAR